MEWHVQRMRLAAANFIELLLFAGVGVFFVLAPLDMEKYTSDYYFYALFTPNGHNLSVWVFISLLLAAFCLYALFLAARRNPEQGTFIDRIGSLFVVSCILSIGWLYSWRMGQVYVSTGAITLLAVSLGFIYLRLKVGVSRSSLLEKYLAHAPLSFYLGWIATAAIASIINLLIDLNIRALNPMLWVFLFMALSVVASILVLARRGDVFFPLAVAWALLAMFVEQLFNAGFSSETITTSSGVGAVMICGAVIYRLASGYEPRANASRSRI